MRGLQLQLRALELFLDMRRALHRGLLCLPDFLEIGKLPFQHAELFLEVLEPLRRRLVGLLLQGLAFDLELDDAALEPVHRLRFRIDFDTDSRSRLVDQVDRLVRQLPVADVTVREHGRSDDCRVRDLDAMMHFVTLFQPAQDGDRVLDRRLFDEHLLETPFERCILFEVLAVFVERGRADAMQFATSQCRLQHVARVHRAFGLAGADHRVQFVDEQDDLAFLFREVVEHPFQAFFELATELGAGDQRAHVERQDALAAQSLGDFVVDDALREALDDRCLADTGLADQHGIVLRAALQDLDRAPDFVVAADDRVELALLGALGQVDREFFERLARVFRVRVIDLRTTTQIVDGLLDRPTHGACLFHHAAQRRLVVHRRQHEQLTRDVLVAPFLGQLVGDVEELRQFRADMHVAARTFDARQTVDGLAELRTQQVHVDAGLGQQSADTAALLVEQGHHHMYGLDELVITADGERLRIRQCHLEFARQFVQSHCEPRGRTAGNR